MNRRQRSASGDRMADLESENMLESIASSIGSKVVTALLVLGCIGAGIYFYRNPDDLRTIWHVIKYALVWIGFVLVLPWATFFIPRWVIAHDSNSAAALMLIGYVLVDVVFALFLAGIRGHGALAWGVMLVGFLAAGVYNFLACEYQATRLEGV